MSSSLARLVYRSRRLNVDRATRLRHLEDILASARAFNAANDVSGVLLHDDAWFLQVLEGAPATLRVLFERIVADERHADPILISVEPMAKRRFGAWSMAAIDLGLDARMVFLRMGLEPSIDRARLTVDQIVALADGFAHLSDIDFDEADEITARVA